MAYPLTELQVSPRPTRPSQVSTSDSIENHLVRLELLGEAREEMEEGS